MDREEETHMVKITYNFDELKKLSLEILNSVETMEYFSGNVRNRLSVRDARERLKTSVDKMLLYLTDGEKNSTAIQPVEFFNKFSKNKEK